MNVQNLVKQCEMVVMLSNGATNNELDYVYQTAQNMVAESNGKSNELVFRNVPDDVKLADVCALMRNLRMWQFCVIGDLATQYQWKQVANMKDIVLINDEYAVKYRV